MTWSLLFNRMCRSRRAGDFVQRNAAAERAVAYLRARSVRRELAQRRAAEKRFLAYFRSFSAAHRFERRAVLERLSAYRDFRAVAERDGGKRAALVKRALPYAPDASGDGEFRQPRIALERAVGDRDDGLRLPLRFLVDRVDGRIIRALFGQRQFAVGKERVVRHVENEPAQRFVVGEREIFVARRARVFIVPAGGEYARGGGKNDAQRDNDCDLLFHSHIILTQTRAPCQAM